MTIWLMSIALSIPKTTNTHLILFYSKNWYTNETQYHVIRTLPDLSCFNIYIFSTEFHIISNFMGIRPLVAALIHAQKRTKERTEGCTENDGRPLRS